MNELKQGLRPLPPDERDFTLGAFIGAENYPKLTELPESFSLGEPFTIKNQNDPPGNEDMCTAYATTGMSEYQEKVELYPQFSFATSKKLSGDPEGWGQNLRDAMASHVKFGAVEPKDVTPGDLNLSAKDRRYFDKYSIESQSMAVQHSKSSYLTTKGPYSAYDNIRCALWMYRGQKRAVGIGLEWGWPLSQYLLSGTPSGFGHMMYVIGWDRDGLITVNSAGKDAGINGLHRLTRETIEAYVVRYGAYMFIDLTPEAVRAKITSQIGFLESLVNFLKQLGEFLFGKKKLMDDSLPPELKPEHVSKIKLWAEAIKDFEGWYPGSASHRRNNPGNVKGGDGKFLTFKTYDEGFQYLCDYLTRACTGKHKAYKPDMTLYAFTRTYAPDGDIIVDNYSAFVAKRLGVFPSEKIKDLL